MRCKLVLSVETAFVLVCQILWNADHTMGQSKLMISLLLYPNLQSLPPCSNWYGIESTVDWISVCPASHYWTKCHKEQRHYFLAKHHDNQRCYLSGLSPLDLPQAVFNKPYVYLTCHLHAPSLISWQTIPLPQHNWAVDSTSPKANLIICN